MKTISERIKEGLELRGMRQADLVEKTKIGKSSISTYISGEYEPKQKNIYKIAQALNVSESWLMGYDEPIEASAHPGAKRFYAPVLGKIQAGIALEAVECILDYEEISEDMARKGEHFALKVQGDSMEPKFSEGDVVIVKKQSDIESGEIGIVLVNGHNATIKRIIKHEEGGISLIASNPVYSPKYYTDNEILNMPVNILGKVVELRAKF